MIAEIKILEDSLDLIINTFPGIEKNKNWGSEMNGASGFYKFYSLFFNQKELETTHSIFVKYYQNGRAKGKYSLLAE